jgi:hypothetical protein
MFVYAVYYFKSYSAASEKSVQKAEAIEKDTTRMVPPHLWIWKRLLPVMIIGVGFVEILKFVLNYLWSALDWLVAFIYEGAGTSIGDVFEKMLMDIAGIEGMGIPLFICFLIVLLIVAVYFFVKYLDWVFHLGASFFVTGWNLAKLLKGDKATGFAAPFLVFLEQGLRVALATFLLYAAPFVAWSISEATHPTVGVWVMASFLFWSVKIPDGIFGLEKLSDSWAAAGDWVDEGFEPEYVESPKRLVRRATKALVDHTPESVKLAYETGWRLAKQHPQVATVAAAVGTISRAASDPQLAAETLMKAGAKITTPRIHSSSSAGGYVNSQRTSVSRESVLAGIVARNKKLYETLKTLNPQSERELALLHKLASHYHSGTPQESLASLEDRYLREIDGMSESERGRLAALGRSVALDAFESHGDEIDWAKWA